MYPQDPRQGYSQQSSYYSNNPYYGQPQGPKNSNVLAIVGIVLASLGLLLFWIPFLGLILAIAGVAFACIALGRGQLKALSITGICVASVAALISLLVTGGFLVRSVVDASSSTTSDPSTASASSYSSSASAESSSSAPTSTPTVSPSATATPVPKQADLSTFHEVDDRELALIAKSPKTHVGEKIIINGSVTQLDSATGPCAMRVNIGATYQPQTYDYETNSIVFDSSDDGKDKCPTLEPLVQDDNVKLWVMVGGSETYDTQIGGSTTVPVFAASKAEIQ